MASISGTVEGGGGILALLSKFIAGQRQKKVVPYIKGDVLDLGCGNAQVLKAFAERMNSYCGVERSAALVERLRLEYPDSTFLQLDLDASGVDPQQKFDCILMIALIEHLFNQKFVMGGLAKLLKPDGVIVITTPTPFGNDVVHRTGAALGLFSKAAVDDHIVLYNRHRFSILASEVGLQVKHHQYFQLYCNQLAILGLPKRC